MTDINFRYIFYRVEGEKAKYIAEITSSQHLSSTALDKIVNDFYGYGGKIPSTYIVSPDGYQTVGIYFGDWEELPLFLRGF